MSKLSQTKLIRLLQTITETEWKTLEQWVASPWCNSNKNVGKLLQKLKKYHPEFSARDLTKEKLFHRILPNGKFSDRRMNNILSETYLLTERFLIFQRLAEQQDIQRALLQDELQLRQLEDWYVKLSEKEINRLEDLQVKNWEDHVALYRTYRSRYQHPNQEIRMQPGSPSIINMERQLDLMYGLEKAAIINEKISRNRVFRGENHEVEADIRKWKVMTEHIKHPALDLYCLRFDYTDDNRWTQYHKIRQQLVDCFSQLNEKEQKVHLLSLINDTISFIKSGKLALSELLPMYQLGLENGVLLDQGKITESTYTTVVVLSNSKGDFDYTYSFIDRYTPKLEEKVQPDCLHWAQAHTAYWQQELELCLDILQEYNFQKFYFQLLGRMLHTQAYFDLYLKDDSYQLFLFNYLDAFEKWLNREKVWSKKNKISFLRFVQKCRTLAKCYGDIIFQVDKVSTLLEDTSNIQALDWLKRKQREVLERRI